jgi:hypothetical protein
VEYAGHIVVEDASGCRFEVHEYRHRRLLSRVATYTLDTGEPLNRVDAETFVIATTGESLVRVEQT